ncbi:MAG: LEA type 2 family protein [Spirochaetaceae bacterium]|jgi:LEA14-like dessication related protein|nr:LEA type 2 family protein [Spirochaetaceae bacterium]
MKRLAAFPAVLVLLCACKSLGPVIQEPRLSLNDLAISGISFEGVALLAKVNVENPNAFSIPFPRVDWNFFVNEHSFLAGTIKENLNIAGRAISVMDIPFTVSYKELAAVAGSLMDHDEAACLLRLSAVFPVPFLEDRPFTREAGINIPLLKLPSVSFKGFSLKNISLSRIEAELIWEIENKNAFALGIERFDYSFAVNNNSWAEGSAAGRPRITARGRTSIPLTISLNSLSMIQGIMGMVNQGTPASYSCDGNITLAPDLPGLGAFSLPFAFQGSSRLK